ncbi:toll/interleukin-1 receptor domain-containing protein [Sphingopyxis sp. NFH-91]|uniref:toll/interleukin-1 receptor domain-containing protein n=1 Tax=Sphingopyxis sp. NFH-91 TaxID=2744457 RepID=UPI001F322ED1|nr:toll/interleukin-1 receptor domain-containing protein [Sphingopyxis sp. NFH-91]
MIRYPTRSDMLRIAATKSATEQASLRKSAESRSPSGATFLSHSSKDQDLLPAAITLLENHGATVYVDKKDPALPPYTSRATAAGLKNRIQQSRKFVLLASQNSKDSRWVPWELGLADGYKGMGRVAILPTVEDQSEKSWAQWEYLGLYDRIVWGDHQQYSEKIWMVLDEEDNTATELRAWLRA